MRVRDVVTRRAFGVVALALAFVGTACGGDSTSPTGDERGSYVLTKVNNQNVPVSFTGTALGNVVIQKATVTLNPGSPSSYTASFDGTVNGVAQNQFLTDGGTYVRTNSTLTFTSLAGFGYAGSLNDKELSVSVPGAPLGIAGSLNLILQRQ